MTFEGSGGRRIYCGLSHTDNAKVPRLLTTSVPNLLGENRSCFAPFEETTLWAQHSWFSYCLSVSTRTLCPLHTRRWLPQAEWSEIERKSKKEAFQPTVPQGKAWSNMGWG